MRSILMAKSLALLLSFFFLFTGLAVTPTNQAFGKSKMSKKEKRAAKREARKKKKCEKDGTKMYKDGKCVAKNDDMGDEEGEDF